MISTKMINLVHMQTAANMLYIARVKTLKSNQLRKKNVPQAVEELERAKGLLSNSIRSVQYILILFTSHI